MIMADEQSKEAIILGKGEDLLNEFINIVKGLEETFERDVDREGVEWLVDTMIEQAREFKRMEHKQENHDQEASSELVAEFFKAAMKEDK